MVTDDQILPLSLQHGLDTKTAEKQVSPGNLLDLQNGVFSSPSSITKRWGYDLVSQAAGGFNLNSASAIQHFNNELLLFDNHNAYSRAIGDNQWVSKGQFTSVILKNQTIVRNNVSQSNADCASLNGLTLVCWQESGTVKYSIIDEQTNAYIINGNSLDSAASGCKVIAFPAANMFVIVYGLGSDLASGKIRFKTISTSNPTAFATTIDIAAGHIFFDGFNVLHNIYDVVIGNNLLYLVFYGGTTNSGVSVKSFDATFITSGGSGGTTQTVEITSGFSLTGATDYCFPTIIVDNSGFVWIAFVDGAKNLYTARFTSSLTVNISATLVGTSPSTQTQSIWAITMIDASLAQPNQIFFFWQVSDAIVWKHYIQARTYNLNTGFISAVVFVRGLGIASKAFFDTKNNTFYLVCSYQNTLGSVYIVMDATKTGNVVGKMLPSLGAGLSTSLQVPQCDLVNGQANIFQVATGILGNIFSQNGQLSVFTGVNKTIIDLSNNNQFLSSPLNHGLYTVGGVLQSYDTNQFAEHGFTYYPESITTSTNSAGSTHKYGYAVCYAWLDNNGFTQWSTPSVVQYQTTANAVGASGCTITIVTPSYRITNKTNVQIVIFRTTDKGTLLYQVTSPTSPTYSNIGNDTISFTDSTTDAALQSNALMYTQPLTTGANPVLPNSAPPACSLIAAYGNRLFLAGTDDPNQIFYTKEKTINVPMEFSNSLTINVEPEGGVITALKTLDDKLIVFKKYSIYYVAGQGPTATGDQNDLTTVTKIPSDVGCIQPNSVVEIPEGLMFQSAKGIYLLTRSEQVVYIGAKAEKYNNLTITSATVVPPQWAVFTTNTDTAIVYDYLQQEWGTFTNHNAVDSDIWTGNSNLFVWASSDGYVHQQNLTSFLDGGNTQYNVSFTSAWLSLNNLQGFQRVKKLFIVGTYYGNATSDVVTVNIGYDFNDTFTHTATVNLTTLTGGLAGPFQFRVDLNQQKCQSIRIQVVDTQSVAGASNFSIDAITLKVGMKKGGQKVPAVKQFGAT